MISVRLLLLTGMTCLALAGCDSKNKIPLKGTRIAVDMEDEGLKADADTSTVTDLPSPESGRFWPQSGGEPDHAMPPLALADHPKEIWSHSIGTGKTSEGRILTSPIAAEGYVYTMDSESRITAISGRTGQVVWSEETAPEGKNGYVLGGGLAYHEGKLYAATAYAELVTLDAKSGKILWRTPLSSPSRTAPTLADGRLYVVTINNQLEVFSINQGKKLWNHSGILESAGLLGAASPAVKNNVAIAVFTSGELFALKAENGHPLWAESFHSSRRADSASALAHIKARPIIEENQVFAISHNGRMSALDLRTGQRLWERSMGGIRTPAIAGNYLFVITTHNDIVCLTKDHGQIVWTKRLPQNDPKETKEKLLWAGPILAGSNNSLKLYITGSNGQILTLDPYTGDIKDTLSVGEPIYLSPIVAEETLYVLTDYGHLHAFH